MKLISFILTISVIAGCSSSPRNSLTSLPGITGDKESDAKTALYTDYEITRREVLESIGKVTLLKNVQSYKVSDKDKPVDSSKVFALIEKGYIDKKLRARTGLLNFIIAKINAESATDQFLQQAPVSDETTYPYVKAYIEYGTALSDSYCTQLFKRQFNNEEDYKHKQSKWRLFGDLTLAGIGLHDSTSSSAVAGWALAFSGIDRYQENEKLYAFLSGDTIEAVKKKLEAARKVNRDNLTSKRGRLEYSVATEKLRTYHETCGYAAIKGFIQESITKATYIPDSRGPDTSKLDVMVGSSLQSIQARNLSSAIAQLLNSNATAPLPQRYLRALFSHVYHGDSTVSQADKAPDSPYATYITAYTNAAANHSAIKQALSELDTILDLAKAHRELEAKAQTLAAANIALDDKISGIRAVAATRAGLGGLALKSAEILTINAYEDEKKRNDETFLTETGSAFVSIPELNMGITVE